MKTGSKIILSIDPGYDRCGVAVIQSDQGDRLLFSDCLMTNKNSNLADRLTYIYNALLKIVEKYSPNYLVLETLFFSVNKKTAIKVAEARGTIVLMSGQKNIPLLELSPQEVKIALTGAGNADKKQVQKMVELALKIPIDNKLDDEIDAIALGFAGAGHLRLDF